MNGQHHQDQTIIQNISDLPPDIQRIVLRTTVTAHQQLAQDVINEAAGPNPSARITRQIRGFVSHIVIKSHVWPGWRWYVLKGPPIAPFVFFVLKRHFLPGLHRPLAPADCLAPGYILRISRVGVPDAWAKQYIELLREMVALMRRMQDEFPHRDIVHVDNAVVHWAQSYPRIPPQPQQPQAGHQVMSFDQFTRLLFDHDLQQGQPQGLGRWRTAVNAVEDAVERIPQAVERIPPAAVYAGVIGAVGAFDLANWYRQRRRRQRLLNRFQTAPPQSTTQRESPRPLSKAVPVSVSVVVPKTSKTHATHVREQAKTKAKAKTKTKANNNTKADSAVKAKSKAKMSKQG